MKKNIFKRFVVEVRLDDKEDSLAAYKEYIQLEIKEKDPARIQVPVF
jgi:hypothetical protein